MNGATNVGENYNKQIEKCKALKVNYSMILPDGYDYESAEYIGVANEAIKSTRASNDSNVDLGF